MNNSNAAAKRRRAGIQPTTPPMPTQNQQQSNTNMANGQSAPPGGYTLPQVIALIDTRLITLEKFMKETKESTDLSIPNYSRDSAAPVVTSEDSDGGAVFMDSKEFTEFVDDINQRFQLFADEINGLKEIVLKLQGFTMDVNKMLLASLSKNGEAVPNITFDVDSEGSLGGDGEPSKMELAEQTFVLESSSSTSTVAAASDGVESAVEKAVSSSGKNKKR